MCSVLLLDDSQCDIPFSAKCIIWCLGITFLQIQKAEIRKKEWRYFVHYLVSMNFLIFRLLTMLVGLS